MVKRIGRAIVVFVVSICRTPLYGSFDFCFVLRSYNRRYVGKRLCVFRLVASTHFMFPAKYKFSEEQRRFR